MVGESSTSIDNSQEKQSGDQGGQPKKSQQHVPQEQHPRHDDEEPAASAGAGTRSSKSSSSRKAKYFLPRIMTPPSTISIPFASVGSSNGSSDNVNNNEAEAAASSSSQPQQAHHQQQQQRRRSSTAKKLRNKVQAISSGASVSSTATPTSKKRNKSPSSSNPLSVAANVTASPSASQRLYAALMNGASGIGGSGNGSSRSNSHRRSSFSKQQRNSGTTTALTSSLNTTMESTTSAESAIEEEDDNMSGITIDPHEEELLEKLGAMVGKRLSALATRATADDMSQNSGKNSAHSTTDLANDAFLKRLAMISSSIGGNGHNVIGGSVNGDGSIAGGASRATSIVRSGSGVSLTQFFNNGDGGGSNVLDGSFSNLISDSGSLLSTSQVSYNSFISGTNIDQKTHSELVLSLERTRDKLQQMSADLTNEKARRKNREFSLIKLAKELSRTRQQVQDNETIIKKLRGEKRYLKAQLETFQEDLDRQIKTNNELQSQIKIAGTEEKQQQEKHNVATIIQNEHEKRIEDLKLSHANQCDELCREIISANQEVSRLNILLEQHQAGPSELAKDILKQEEANEGNGNHHNDKKNMQIGLDPNEVELKQQQWQQDQLLQQEQLQQTTKRYLDNPQQQQQRKTRTLSFRKSLTKNQSHQQQQRAMSWNVSDDTSTSGLVFNASNNSGDKDYYYHDDCASNGGIIGHFATTDTGNGGNYDPMVLESSIKVASSGRLFGRTRRLLSLKKLSRRQRRRRLIILVITGIVLAYWAISKSHTPIFRSNLPFLSSSTKPSDVLKAALKQEPQKHERRPYLHDAMFVNMESTGTISEAKRPSVYSDNTKQEKQQHQNTNHRTKSSAVVVTSRASSRQPSVAEAASPKKKVIVLPREVEPAPTSPSLNVDATIRTHSTSTLPVHLVGFKARVARIEVGWKSIWNKLMRRMNKQR